MFEQAHKSTTQKNSEINSALRKERANSKNSSPLQFALNSSDALGASHILALQQTYGNHMTSRIIQGMFSVESAEASVVQKVSEKNVIQLKPLPEEKADLLADIKKNITDVLNTVGKNKRITHLQVAKCEPAIDGVIDTLAADVRQATLDNQIPALRVRYDNLKLWCDQILARQDAWANWAGTFVDKLASYSILPNALNDALIQYGKAFYQQNPDFDAAQQALQAAMDHKISQNIGTADAESKKGNPEDGLSHTGKQTTKALFEGMISDGSISLHSNSVYKSPFDAGTWDFGCEWTLNESKALAKPYADNWVLHAHSTLNPKKVDEMSKDLAVRPPEEVNIVDYDNSDFNVKVAHVKPKNHIMDTGWSEDIDLGKAAGKFDKINMLNLCKANTNLFKALSSSHYSRSKLPLSNKAFKRGINYRVKVDAAFDRKISGFYGGHKKAKESVSTIINGMQQRENTTAAAIQTSLKNLRDVDPNSPVNETLEATKTNLKQNVTDVQNYISGPINFVKTKDIKFYKTAIMDGVGKDTKTEKEDLESALGEL